MRARSLELRKRDVPYAMADKPHELQKRRVVAAGGS
jgi:hypothetical protein